MSGKFRAASGFDPWLIISQIILVQLLFYLGWAAICLLLSLLRLVTEHQAPFEFFRLFTTAFGEDDGFNVGCRALLAIALVLAGVPGALSLRFIVERHKKCLDHGLTAFVLHLVVSWCYAHAVPASLAWWLASPASFFVMTAYGIVLCQRDEFQNIPLLPEVVKQPAS